MKRCCLSLLSLVLAVPALSAHYIWIVPDARSGSAQVVFSNSPSPDNPELLAKISETQVYARHAGGQIVPLKWTKEDEAYRLSVPGKGPWTIGGVCQYGVIQKGNSEPFLLCYYAKAPLGQGEETSSKSISSAPWERLALEIVPVENKEPRQFRVLWQGKPLPGAEVMILEPGREKGQEVKTDGTGSFAFTPTKSGLHGIRARHVEPREGELAGKKYREVRHYATLALLLADARGERPRAEAAAKPAGLTADPAAGKLLTDARAARAHWVNFPGFSAGVEVNIDGKLCRGQVEVSANGRVRFSNLDKEAEAWARPHLGSIVSHRIDSPDSESECAFLDREENHPLGRAIQVIDDKLRSNYRIRDNQVMVVDRQMFGKRFAITVLENHANQEGKYLPASFVVHYWDPPTGNLLKTDANYQTWKRIGRFDLPVRAQVITAEKAPAAQAEAGKNAYTTKSLTLSNHRLLEGEKE